MYVHLVSYIFSKLGDSHYVNYNLKLYENIQKILNRRKETFLERLLIKDLITVYKEVLEEVSITEVVQGAKKAKTTV